MLFGNNAASVITGGLNDVFAAASTLGLKDARAGLSATGMFSKEITLWNGITTQTVVAKGNYFDTISADLPLEDLGIDKEIFSASGTFSRVVSIWGDGASVINKLQDADDLQSTFKALVSEFSALGTASLNILFKVSHITKGAVKDVDVDLEASMFVTNVDKDEMGIAKGFYAYSTNTDPIAPIVKQIVNSIVSNFGGVLNILFGDGTADAISSNLTPDVSTNTVIGFVANAELAGFHVRIPVIGAVGGVLEFECKVRYAGGDFSCKFDYTEPKWFNGFVEASGWVIREAENFFQNTAEGRVIAAIATHIAEELHLDEAAFWTMHAIQKTAESVVEGTSDLGNAVKTWAKNTGVQICGLQTVTSALKCGTDIVTSGAKWGLTPSQVEASAAGTK